MNEAQLVKLIIQRYNYEPDIFLWRSNSGSMVIDGKGGKRFFKCNIPGTPDIIGFIAPIGRFIGIECKVGRNKQNPNQVAFQEDANKRGAIYILAYSLDDVESVINRLKGVGDE